MKATITPPGQGPVTLELLAEPKYSRGEQGGYRDATVLASIPSSLRSDLKYADITLHGPSAPVYFGRIRDIDGDTLTCEGEQVKLDDLKRGCIYRRRGAGGWQDLRVGYQDPNIGGGVDDSDRLVATFSADQAYKANRHIDWVLDFPEPTSSARLFLTTDQVSASFEVKAYYATGWSRRTWGSAILHADGSDINAGYTISASNITALRILVQPKSDITPSVDKVITVMPTAYSTSVTDATVANIATHILTSAGAVSEVDPTLTTLVTDLSYDTASSELSKFADLLKLGDWRFYFDARLVGGGYVPVGILAPRPTTPIYSLTENGRDVLCDFVGESAEPLASVVRVRFRDVHGRERYVDVTDTDTSHYLVHAGITRMATIDVDTNDSAMATLAGQRYLADAGRDQVQGTVTLLGSPGGIPACEYVPGELLRVATKEGRTVVVRIADADYEGAYSAQLRVDNTPSLADLLYRLNAAKSKSAMMRV